MSSLTNAINETFVSAPAHRVLTPDEKTAVYDRLRTTITAVLDGERDTIARMATITGLLTHSLPYAFWTGFYQVDPRVKDELVVGPYQGTLGCLRIAFGRGVCGTSARTRQTIVVPDVHSFPGHIACDSRSRSEIVVPVFDPYRTLLAVLDIDSEFPQAFDDIDRRNLEAILQKVFGAS